MGCIAAGGPRRHPSWPPSLILLKIQICRENSKIAIFFARVVQFDRSEYDVFLLVTQAYSDKVKKIRVLPTGVEPMTFRLVLRMLYH